MLLSFGSLAFKISRRRRYCRDTGQRAINRATRREERRNLCAFRRAARRHRWAEWLHGFRHVPATDDYEEKRALVLRQEGVLEGVMQGEIRNLERANEIANDMVRAEEGRARLYYQVNLPPSRRNGPAVDFDPDTSSSSHSIITPSSYTVPPPTYDEELEGEITVVDGFQYTPSASEDTPDSSVIDCSPRDSMETVRTTFEGDQRE